MHRKEPLNSDDLPFDPEQRRANADTRPYDYADHARDGEAEKAARARVALTSPDIVDASETFMEPGVPDHPEAYGCTRVKGEMPKLEPGVLGGIAMFAEECAQWGFDAKHESVARCDDQFDMTAHVRIGINMGMLASHAASYHAGWWHDPDGGVLTDPLLVPTKLMLIVSEIAEAMEGDRKGAMDDHLPHRPAFEVELADVWIRLMDIAGATRIDLAGAVVEKMAYNLARADHKPENREKKGGKAY